MGLSVTAEGVENQPQFELIRRAGCDKAQGHLFGGLLKPDQVERLLTGEDGATESASSVSHGI